MEKASSGLAVLADHVKSQGGQEKEQETEGKSTRPLGNSSEAGSWELPWGPLSYPEHGSRCTQPRADPAPLQGLCCFPAFLFLSGQDGFTYLFIFKDFFILERELQEQEGQRERANLKQTPR